MIYNKKSRSWCHRLLSAVLATIMTLSVLVGTTVPAFAASTGNSSGLGEITGEGGTPMVMPFPVEPVVRVYPVEYDESIDSDNPSGAINMPEDLTQRWMYSGGTVGPNGEIGATYALYAHLPGHTYTYDVQLHPRIDLDENGKTIWRYTQRKGITSLFVTPVAGGKPDDNLFLDWLNEGLSGGLDLSGDTSSEAIGVALRQYFYNKIADDKELGQKFWEDYFSVFLGKYGVENQPMVDHWRELLAKNKLSMIVDMNAPVKMLSTTDGEQRGYINVTDFLTTHEIITGKEAPVSPRSEKAYVDLNPYGLACWGASGGNGNPPCSNIACAKSGHIRYAMGQIARNLTGVIRPEDATGLVSGLADRYGSWGHYYITSEMNVPTVQLIEQWQYFDNGVKVHEDEKFRKSYDTLTLFKQSGDADREADETSKWGGDDFTFNEYSYTITEVDTSTGAEKGVLDPPGRPEASEPQITVSTNEMQANKAYKIVVIAKYVKEWTGVLCPFWDYGLLSLIDAMGFAPNASKIDSVVTVSVAMGDVEKIPGNAFSASVGILNSSAGGGGVSSTCNA